MSEPTRRDNETARDVCMRMHTTTTSLDALIAVAIADEREQCCRDVCQFCHGDDYEVSEHAVLHNGLWVHESKDSGTLEDCAASRIRVRGAA